MQHKFSNILNIAGALYMTQVVDNKIMIIIKIIKFIILDELSL